MTGCLSLYRQSVEGESGLCVTHLDLFWNGSGDWVNRMSFGADFLNCRANRLCCPAHRASCPEHRFDLFALVVLVRHRHFFDSERGIPGVSGVLANLLSRKFASVCVPLPGILHPCTRCHGALCMQASYNMHKSAAGKPELRVNILIALKLTDDLEGGCFDSVLTVVLTYDVPNPLPERVVRFK